MLSSGEWKHDPQDKTNSLVAGRRGSHIFVGTPWNVHYGGHTVCHHTLP
jgi:hypothetical protein